MYECCWQLLRDGLLKCSPQERVDVHDLCEALNLILDKAPRSKLDKLLTASTEKRKTVYDGSAEGLQSLQSAPLPIDESSSPGSSTELAVIRSDIAIGRNDSNLPGPTAEPDSGASSGQQAATRAEVEDTGLPELLARTDSIAM